MCSFSLEGEGWDEGDITSRFYSPIPNSLQQERERSVIAFSLCVWVNVQSFVPIHKLCLSD